MKYLYVLSAILIAAVSLTACSKKSSKQTMFYGDAITLGPGSMKSWIQTDENGKPVSLGFTISEAAIAALPSTDTMYMLMMPMMSGNMSMTMPSPFDHLEINWAPNGDAGSAVFNHAHLDCHFFTINSSTQMGIMMGMDTAMIGANYLPQNCKADSVAEANMGVHVYDTLSAEYHGSPFDHTFMYGFYQGNMTFVEVMCAKYFLDAKTNYTGNISQPIAFKHAGYYPLKYTVSYNASAKEYLYSLDNLTSH
jgi:hypothetical protein